MNVDEEVWQRLVKVAEDKADPVPVVVVLVVVKAVVQAADLVKVALDRLIP